MRTTTEAEEVRIVRNACGGETRGLSTRHEDTTAYHGGDASKENEVGSRVEGQDYDDEFDDGRRPDSEIGSTIKEICTEHLIQNV